MGGDVVVRRPQCARSPCSVLASFSSPPMSRSWRRLTDDRVVPSRRNGRSAPINAHLWTRGGIRYPASLADGRGRHLQLRDRHLFPVCPTRRRLSERGRSCPMSRLVTRRTNPYHRDLCPGAAIVSEDHSLPVSSYFADQDFLEWTTGFEPVTLTLATTGACLAARSAW